MGRKKATQKCSKGNTIPLSEDRSRDWAFTSFEKDMPNFDNENMKYLICGAEICPTTQKKHFQCYVHFKHQKTWSATQKYFEKYGKIHFEACKGSAESNIKYCSKDGNFKEFGEKPQQGKRNDLNLIKDQIVNGGNVEDILMDNPMIYHQYGRTLEKIEDVVMRNKSRTEMTKGVWLYGPTGCGKSHMAFENYNAKSHYVYPNDNGWWDGYKQQETVIFNEFRGEITFKEMLDLCDKWPKKVKRRSREPMPFTSSTIIVTSALHPKEIYSNVLSKNDAFEQFERRFDVIYLGPDGPTDDSDDESDEDL